jgi:hypothetical protein
MIFRVVFMVSVVKKKVIVSYLLWIPKIKTTSIKIIKILQMKTRNTLYRLKPQLLLTNHEKGKY